MKSLRPLLIAVILVLALQPATVLADYVRSYRDGFRALDRKRWAEVESHMRAALAEKAETGESVMLYGMRSEPYLPQYYLGLALYQQGNCAGALAAWTESVRLGAVQQQPAYGELQKYQGDCDQKLGLSAAAGTAQRNIDAAQGALLVVDDARTGNAEAWKALPQLRTSRETAAKDLETARQLLKRGKELADVKMIGEAGSAAQRITTSLQSVQKQLANWKPPEPEPEPEPTRRFPDDAGVTKPEPFPPPVPKTDPRVLEVRRRISGDANAARESLGTFTKIKSPSSGLRDEKRRLEFMIERSRTVSEIENLRTLETIESELQQSTRDFNRLIGEALLAERGQKGPLSPSGPPELLVRVATTYFRGDYRKVLDELKNADLVDPRARAYGYLFRAAANFNLYRLDGSRSDQLLNEASSAARACRTLDPGVRPSDQYFSSSFIEFFKDSG